ncbi:MAG: ATP-binding cassette domain-containing protein [Clostridia bacterium]|nr:ATP-binding cassette domain-containing protein [Clostridia bacterium]
METFKIENLTFTYPEASSPAISDINLSVNQGDFLVLCGHSGCGKTTLLRHLKKSLAPHGNLAGNILFCGTPTENLDEREAASQIGYVFQNPELQIVTDKVWHELAFTLESIGAEQSTIRRRCAEMAAFFGIEDWYYKNVNELSGGQKQLLCLASVMTVQPRVLVLDEPTAQLDPIAAADFIAALGKINREIGTTIILSEHRLEDAIPLANKVAVMENGRLLCCDTAENVGAFLKARESAMFCAMPTAMQVWGSVDTDLPCPITVSDGRNFLNRYFETHTKQPVLVQKNPTVCGKEQIKITEAFFRYEKDTPDVVKNLELSAFAGELLCILGGNGSGKTTTLKLISGICKPYRGTVLTNGRVGLLPQDPKTVFVKNTVLADLKSVLKTKGEASLEAVQKTARLCKIESLLERHPYDLSGGEQQRVALAKILLTAPDILLLDEPTKGFDMPFKEDFAAILQDLKDNGICIVMVSHDIEFCAKYADRCGMFFDGGLVSCSAPREFFSGNGFYTTAANRMTRGIANGIITTDEAVSLVGGKTVSLPKPTVETPTVTVSLKSGNKKTILPLWRKIGASVSALLALIVFVYAVKNEDFTEMISSGGLTAIGQNQLRLYLILIALVAVAAVFLGKRAKGGFAPPQEKRKLSKRTTFSAILILLLLPITLYIGVVYLERKQYYITALLVLTECMLPFFLVFEGRRPKARELVIIATLCALGVAGRAAFFMLPQFKPVMAVTIISGVALGGEVGFFVGAGTMLVSNILFAQGPWTPWQMFAMGIIGFLAGILFQKRLFIRAKASLCVFGVLAAFVIYGGLMNLSSALIWNAETLNIKILLSYYATGLPMDAVHAGATALFLWFGAEPMLEKLDRIKTKYGIIT